MPDSVETVGSDALPDDLSEITFGQNFASDASLFISGDANNSPVVIRFRCQTPPLNLSISGTTSRKLIFITPEDSDE